jgi:hypothetical protein
MTVRAACQKCNNGWMADLETDTAVFLRRWLAESRLAIGGAEVISRWLATRLLVWTVRDGGGRNLAEALAARQPAAIPHFDRARRLAANASDALDDIAVGVALGSGDTTYSFGNASTRPNGRARSFTAVLALKVAPFQLWVADSPIGGDVRLPAGVTALRDGLALEGLVNRGNDISSEQVIFRFPPSQLEAAASALTGY